MLLGLLRDAGEIWEQSGLRNLAGSLVFPPLGREKGEKKRNPGYQVGQLRSCHCVTRYKLSEGEFCRGSICNPSFLLSENLSSSLATSPVRGLKMTTPAVTVRLSLTMHRAHPAATAM